MTKGRKLTLGASVAVLLLALIPLSSGPLYYVFHRGWLPPEAFEAVYWPLADPFPRGTALQRLHTKYVNWWADLAADHSLD